MKRLVNHCSFDLVGIKQKLEGNEVAYKMTEPTVDFFCLLLIKLFLK